MENETTNQFQAPQTPAEQAPVTMVPEKSSTSGIIGTIIIIALIILGGLYFWGKRISTQQETASLINQEQVAAQEAAAIQAVSTSDEVDTLQAELDATITSDLGAELE